MDRVALVSMLALGAVVGWAGGVGCTDRCDGEVIPLESGAFTGRPDVDLYLALQAPFRPAGPKRMAVRRHDRSVTLYWETVEGEQVVEQWDIVAIEPRF